MKSKDQKKKELTQLKEKLPKTKITVLTAFAPEGKKGLTVSQMQQFKRGLRELEGEYVITKKTLMNRAFGKSYDGLDVFGMVGSLGLVLGYGDPYAIAKKAYEFSRKNDALTFFGAIFEGQFIDGMKFLELAQLPSREMLLARLFAMMKFPLMGLAITLSEVAKKKELSATS